MILLIFIPINLFCFPQSYHAEKYQSALMKKKTGAMVVYTGEHHSFTIDIIADNIKPGDKPNFLVVDNKILQSSIIPFLTKLDFENLSGETQKKNLLGYMDYEMNHIKDQLKTKELNEKYEFIILNNKIFLYWTYDMPESYKTVINQCYLITICFDQMLVLNSPVDKGETLNDIKNFLSNTGKTLKLNDHPIDLEKLYNELNIK
jgi:hypothetical protein